MTIAGRLPLAVALLAAISVSAIAQTKPTIPRTSLSAAGDAVSGNEDLRTVLGAKCDVDASACTVVVNGATYPLSTAIAPLSSDGALNLPAVRLSSTCAPGQIYGCGSVIRKDGMDNWNVLQTGLNLNPTEWNVYGAAAQGNATVSSGNALTRQDGTPFDAFWVGRAIGFGQTLFKVAAVSDASHLTLINLDGSTPVLSAGLNENYMFALTFTTSTCNVSGSTVTRTAGGYFFPLASSLTINGTAYNATYVSPTQMSIAGGPGTLTGATCLEAVDINQQVSTIRVQRMIGNEENMSLYASTYDGYHIRALYSGYGRYRGIHIETGENPAGTMFEGIDIEPGAAIGQPGAVGIGGRIAYGNTGLVVPQVPTAVNHLEIVGGPTGYGPSLRMRGKDANIPGAFDAQGAAGFVWTNNGFGQLLATLDAVGNLSAAKDVRVGTGGVLKNSKNTLSSLLGTGTAGDQTLCTDCRKPGEGTGAGTGMTVFNDGRGWISTAGTPAAN